MPNSARIVVLTLGFIAITLPAGAAEKAAVTIHPFPPTYIEFYRQILADHRDNPKETFGSQAALAGVALRLWMKTNEPEFRAQAVNSFARCLSDPGFNLKDFHVLHHFGELAATMKEKGLLTPEQKQKISDIARATLADYLKQPDDAKLPPGAPLFNIRVGQIAGYAGLLKCLRDEAFDQREDVSRRLDAYFDLLCVTGTTEEDAANYDSLGMAFAVDLARLLGRESDLKSPAFKQCFNNIRDIVSPSGMIPEYGDSYFTYYGAPIDRIYLMEYAARVFGDVSFAAASRQMRSRPIAGALAEDEWVRSLHLIDMGEPYPANGPVERTASQVLLHNITQDGKSIQAVPDKLILRTGQRPGDAMVMLDLYARGSHAAKDKGPSIAYYESGQVPLFHNMGRRGTRSAIAGNICWALPPAEQFPGVWKPGQWFTMAIPTNLLANDGGGKCQLSSITLRNFPGHADNRGCTSLWFDNLRLEGPGASRLVDGFERATGWDSHLERFTEPQDSPDKTEGRFSQQIAWNKVNTENVSRTFPASEPFARDQYDFLKLDVKFAGTRPYMLVRGYGPSWEELELGDQVLRPILKNAETQQRESDAAGSIRHEQYVTRDTTMHRRLVLTREGYLLVRDDLRPGPTMDGWNAGQLWQLYTLAAQGEHWFCSDDDGVYPNVNADSKSSPQRRMFVKFAAGEDKTQTACEKVPRSITWPNPKGLPATSYVTTFSRRKVTAGHSEVFGMVVLPVEAGIAADAVSKDVSIAMAADGTVQATILSAAGRVDIHAGETEWSVTRTAK